MLFIAVVIGLATSTVAQGATISKEASDTQPHPGDRVTYTITVTATQDGLVEVVDVLPFGVSFAGNLSPPAATYAGGQVSWSGNMTTGETVVIRFDVTVEEPETLGPLPIVNEVCADDGTEVCASTTIYSTRVRVYLPIVLREYAPGPMWPWGTGAGSQ